MTPAANQPPLTNDCAIRHPNLCHYSSTMTSIMAHRRLWTILFLATFVYSWHPAGARAAEIKIAAAADLTFAFKDVTARFEKQTGNSTRLTYGSSGNFFSQIQNGAPFDLFFSADVGFPQKLEAAGLTEPGTIYEYANGQIVIWVPKRIQARPEQRSCRAARSGHPENRDRQSATCAVWSAAVAAMQHEGIYDQVKSKFVPGENISQTAQFVQSGNADVGIVALSLALAPAMKTSGRYVEIPATDYPPLIQAGVILKSSRNKELASSF